MYSIDEYRNEFLHLAVHLLKYLYWKNLHLDLKLVRMMIDYFHLLMLLHRIVRVNDEYFHPTRKRNNNSFFFLNEKYFLLVSNKDQSYSILNQHSLYLFL